MYKIDETDEAIIDVLKKNARLSSREIAKRSGIPPATVHKRMQRLEREGVISGYTVVLNREKLGEEVLAYVLVTTKPSTEHTPMVKDVARHEGVEAAAGLAGEYDMILKVRTKTIKDMDAFVLNYLRKFDEVTKTQTLIVFREWK